MPSGTSSGPAPKMVLTAYGGAWLREAAGKVIEQKLHTPQAFCDKKEIQMNPNFHKSPEYPAVTQTFLLHCAIS